MRQCIHYFEQILIRRLYTLIEQETEPTFRELYYESLQRLMQKHVLPGADHSSLHRLQASFRTQQSR